MVHNVYSWEQYEEAERDMAPPPTLGEQHEFWHRQRDRGFIDAHTACPLDCGENEWQMDEDHGWEDGNVTCGHCKARGRSVEHVRLCPER